MYNIIFFVETADGVKNYKCDTFWSKSTDSSAAKIHQISDIDRFLESLVYAFESSKKMDPAVYRTLEERGNLKEYLKRYNGSKYGYQIFDLDQVDRNGYSLIKDAILSQPVYTHLIYTLTEDKCEVIDLRIIKQRDDKIKIILG